MKALTKLIAIIVFGIVLTLGLVLYLIKPSLDQVVKLNGSLKDKKTESKTLEQQILAFKTAQSDLSKATQKDRILNAVVDRDNLVVAVQNLEAAANASNTTEDLVIDDDVQTVAAISKTAPKIVTQTEAHAGVKEVTFTLSVKNDFPGFINFLKLLEHSPNFTELTNLELTAETADAASGAGGAHTGRLLGNIKGVFYINSDETPTK